MQVNKPPNSFWTRTIYVWIGGCIVGGIGFILASLLLGGLILDRYHSSLGDVLNGYHKSLTDESLISAAFQGHTADAELFIKSGANINCEQPDMRFTPLMCAVSNRHVDTVALLLSHHPDLNRKSIDGKTALQIAKEGHQPELVRMLKAVGAK